MLAQKDSMIKEASDTILQLSQDEQIRQRREARADYYIKRLRADYTIKVRSIKNRTLISQHY